MSDRSDATPIEDYLDDLVRSVRADPRATRRLLDEANDHLVTTADELQATGLARVDAEREAVRRLGSSRDLARDASRQSFRGLVEETVLGAVLLGACGLVAVGLSGALVAIMNGLFGDGFVGRATVLGVGGASVNESAQDAVVLRLLAGVAGLLVLAAYVLLRRHRRPDAVLPHGLVDALGAAAFAAATVALVGASIDQATTAGGGNGVGFWLSGALVSLAGAVLFCTRATRALLPAR